MLLKGSDCPSGRSRIETTESIFKALISDLVAIALRGDRGLKLELQG